MRALVVRWALDYFKRNPASDMVSVDPSDGGGQCECEHCAKLGTVSDRAFGLANEVARAVGSEHPGMLVGLYAYNEHSEPPAAALEPNVYVQLTAGFTRGRYTFEELLELWPQKCRNMGYYEYFSVWPWDFDKLPGGRANDTPYLRKQIARYVKQGATSLDCESSANWRHERRGLPPPRPVRRRRLHRQRPARRRPDDDRHPVYVKRMRGGCVRRTRPPTRAAAGAPSSRRSLGE